VTENGAAFRSVPQPAPEQPVPVWVKLQVTPLLVTSFASVAVKLNRWPSSTVADAAGAICTVMLGPPPLQPTSRNRPKQISARVAGHRELLDRPEENASSNLVQSTELLLKQADRVEIVISS
jgi:hypothetical protein